MRPRCQKTPQFIQVPGNRLLSGCVWCTNGISFAAMQSISAPPECLLNWGPGHARGCVCLQQPHPWSSQPCPTCASEETHISLFIQLVVAQNSMHVFFFNTCNTCGMNHEHNIWGSWFRVRLRNRSRDITPDSRISTKVRKGESILSVQTENSDNRP